MANSIAWRLAKFAGLLDDNGDPPPIEPIAHADTHATAGSDPISAASIGASGTGHSHSLDFGETGDIVASAFGDTAAAGATGEVADAGHRHAREANPITAHEAAGNPHPTYLTLAEGDGFYSVLGHAHGGGGDPPQGSYAPGSYTIADGKFVVASKRQTFTGSQRLTIQGTGRLRIT